MKSKLVYYFPLALFAFGLIWGTQTIAHRPVAYYIGIGVGFMLIPAVPSLLFALIHYLVARGKYRTEQEQEFDLVDSTVQPDRPDYWSYFFNYLSVMGLLLCALVLLRRAGLF